MYEKIKLAVLYIINVISAYISAYIFPIVLLHAFAVWDDSYDPETEITAPLFKIFLAVLILINIFLIIYWFWQYKKYNITKINLLILISSYIIFAVLGMIAFDIKFTRADSYSYFEAIKTFIRYCV